MGAGRIRISQGATPSVPDAGDVRVFAGSDDYVRALYSDGRNRRMDLDPGPAKAFSTAGGIIGGGTDAHAGVGPGVVDRACIVCHMIPTGLDVDTFTFRMGTQPGTTFNPCVTLGIYSYDGATQYWEYGIDATGQPANWAGPLTISGGLVLAPGIYAFVMAWNDTAVRFHGPTYPGSPGYDAREYTLDAGDAANLPATLDPSSTWSPNWKAAPLNMYIPNFLFYKA